MTTFLIVTALLLVAVAAVLADSLKAKVAHAQRCRCPLCDTRRDA